MGSILFREYVPADLSGCLALFGSNCPPYFHPSERAGFQAFLEDPAARKDYFVSERGTELVACGGVWVGEAGVAGLSWGMVRGDLHGQGLGTLLTRYRLERLRLRTDVRQIGLDTSQYTEKFYARYGFVTVQRTPDSFAPGLDEIRMVLNLAPE